MAEIRFAKVHGLGNDFLIVDEAALGGRSLAELTRVVCNRHTGVGADGLVPLGPETAGAWPFRIFNADGTESDLSGNAMRCAAAWVLSHRSSPAPGDVVLLDTRVGRKRHVFRGRQGSLWLFQSEVARPVFTPALIPFRPPKRVEEPVIDFPLPVGDVTVPVTVLWMGNPQCIIFVDNFAELNWQSLGLEIERHSFFPDRVNVGFARVLTPHRIEVRFWERGTGYTLASGTGTCACAVAGAVSGKTERTVAMVTELGEMQVHWREADDIVELSGPAEIVAEGVMFLA
jgi:diaminopimelate epimerase